MVLSHVSSEIDYSLKYSSVDGQGRIRQSDIDEMKSFGVKIKGRYITNECGLYPVEERCWNRELKIEERDLLFKNDISIFQIDQTDGSKFEYFSYENGLKVIEYANKIAFEKYKIPYGTTIYFTVDYNKGLYGFRNTYHLVSKYCGAKYSFISGMSVGYSGNLGFRIPEN